MTGYWLMSLMERPASLTLTLTLTLILTLHTHRRLVESPLSPASVCV